jgi:hypothetical protein
MERIMTNAMYEFPSSGKNIIVIDKTYAAGQMGEEMNH